MSKDILIKIKNQDRVCKVLNEQLNNNLVPQSILFIGQSGSNKLLTAKDLAAVLVGRNYKNAIFKGVMPDVTILKPLGVSGYLANQIKEVVYDTQSPPVQAKNKVFIITQADKLGAASANAFLKTLEEPPSYAYFVLLADNLENILPTIVSRCQIYYFVNIPIKDSLGYIASKTRNNEKIIRYALKLFNGNVDEAISYLSDENLKDLNSEIISCLTNIKYLNEWDILKKSKDICQKIKEIEQVYKNNIDNERKNFEEVFDQSALKEINLQDKRKVSAYEKYLLFLFVSIIEQYLINGCIDDKNKINALNQVNKMREYLFYNIYIETFCDVVLLKVASQLSNSKKEEI